MRRLGSTLFVLLLSIPVFAQTDPASDPSLLRVSDLDLSSATVSQAGPASFYVRSVRIGEERYSILLDQSDAGAWSVRSVIPEAANILPASTVLDFATIRVRDDSAIQIDGVIVDGVFYSGSLAASGDSLELADLILASRSGEVNEARVDSVNALLQARTQEEFDTLLTHERERLESVIVRIEAQRDSFRAERDRLAAQNSDLEAERAELAERLRTAPTTDSDFAASPLSGDQINALLRERDLLAGDVVGLVNENNELRDERGTLAQQIERLQAENATLNDDVEVMTSEVDRLGELVRVYRETVGDLSASDRSAVQPPPSTAWEFPGDYVRRADLDAAAQAVSGELASLSRRVAALEEAASGLANLELELRSGVRSGLPVSAAGSAAGADQAGTLAADSAPAGPPPETRTTAASSAAPATRVDAEDALARAEQAAKLARLQQQLADLEAEVVGMRAEQQHLEERILTEILENGLVRLMSERLTREIVGGFRGFSSDTGAWSITPTRATQTDRSAFFAKSAMELPQSDTPMLYSFTVRSLDSGWVGAGLHLFVDDVRLRRGYGMGSGFLVWITRDPDVRGHDDSFLELYRSDDDVSMARVLEAAIPESVGAPLRVEVLYEPHSQYITIAVNGEDKVRYRTWFGIDSGIELALRSLGRAEFSDFSVRTLP